jgi:hypothetical protein
MLTEQVAKLAASSECWAAYASTACMECTLLMTHVLLLYLACV